VTRRKVAEPGVVRITLARPPHSHDLDQRMIRYLVSMAIRTACVILVIVVHHPVRWVFAAGAVVLPYIAVLLANATDRRTQVRDSSQVDRRGLGAGTPTAPSTRGADDVLTGVVVHPPASPQP
jgi:Protein of unknown function (DUF3099)